MVDATMPATEVMPETAVQSSNPTDDEQSSYEFAFHILPTVADGEVSGVFEELKTLIGKHGGEIFDEEAPERIDLAYEVVLHLEGKNRRFSSAYFGWVRFRAEGAALEAIAEDISARSDVLRHLIIKLTKKEEASPFRFHEARRAEKKHVTIEEREVLTDASKEKDAGEVSEKELDESLERLTGDEPADEESAGETETPKT